jgi:hypothetical protein
VAFPGNTGEAITVGPFLFSPALQLTWEHSDNIFLSPAGPVEDNIYLARARLMLELPIYESYLRFTYTPQYRDFEKFELQEKWSHFVDVAADLQFASGVELNIDYRFVNASLESSEVDAGSEVFGAIGDELFTKHFGRVGIDYWVTNRDGITVSADYTELSYDEGPSDIFYDYERASAGFGWLHQLTQILVMDLQYGHIEFEPKDTISYRKSESDEVTLGFRGQISPVVATELRLGWRETEYDLIETDPPFDEFSGPIIRGHLSWELAHGSSLRLDLLRSDFPSNYAANAYYTATGGTLAYHLNRGRFIGGAFVRFQNNDYELPVEFQGPGGTRVTVDRSDDIKTFRLGLGYRFTRAFSVLGAYLYEDRDSLPEFSYEVNIFTLSLVVGY